MPTDWKQMIRLRERQRTVAMEATARERQALDESLEQLRAAQAHLAQQVAARSALWDGAAAALNGQGCSVEHMQQTLVWSGALAAKVSQAGQEVQQTQSHAAQRNAQWEASRRALRAVAAKVEKAEQLQQRVRGDAARVAEQRLDEALAERSSGAWFQRNG